ncbi:MAG: TetR family transcriptional regulator C-terminal domain-containing protein [Gammaproteobacteria bacterium]|nr:TetR family transcriptional regulator C-terminal domain-containing protein [Gammaproteobacteria bacterium]
MPRKTKARPGRRVAAASGAGRGARATHGRQRQHLIDACISALHLYGPSRTTVEKVVDIAHMSPGIVRFYFASKASMLVASLQFLSTEFEEKVLQPVAALKEDPVAALETLVHLYLDPEIASTRKVSVWYSFWGEASSRQEYYDICGNKDERFAALVRELVERLITRTGLRQLDADGIALGLIGVLEMLWQDFAFRDENQIDRPAARRRCFAYLRSVFPGRFVSNEPVEAPQAPLPLSRHDSDPLESAERRALFTDAWQFAGAEAGLVEAGRYRALDLYAERVLLVRGADRVLRAFRNCCPVQPHDLVADGIGTFGPEGIRCRLHGAKVTLEGAPADSGGSQGLRAFETALVGGLVLVRLGEGPDASAEPDSWIEALQRLGPMNPGRYHARGVAADWKLVVEQCLDLTMPEAAGPDTTWSQIRLTTDSATGRCDWQARLTESFGGWTVERLRRLQGDGGPMTWRRCFVAPNRWLEIRGDGIAVLQVLPEAVGRCRLVHAEFQFESDGRESLAMAFLARRLARCGSREADAVVESMQRAVVAFGYQGTPTAAVSAPVAAFRDWYRRRIARSGR